eukprot:scaffold10244_cov61-Cyclotella_meneghiniana.AAC.6
MSGEFQGPLPPQGLIYHNNRLHSLPLPRYIVSPSSHPFTFHRCLHIILIHARPSLWLLQHQHHHSTATNHAALRAG